MSGGTKTIAPVPIGQRNDKLFRRCLKEALHCDDFDALLDVANTVNDEQHQKPLSVAEVRKTVKSVWEMQEAGKNWVGHGGHAVLSKDLTTKLLAADRVRGGDAVAMTARLKQCHGGRGEDFAFSPDAMARANFAPGWSAHRYRRVRNILLEAGVVVQTHRGGKGLNDPNKYRLV